MTTATLSGLDALDGSVVLVRQTAQPSPGTPVAVRGVLRVNAERESAPDIPPAEIALSFPAMFTSPAWETALPLREDEVIALLATENHGTYEYTYHGSLDDARPRVPVARVMTPAT